MWLLKFQILYKSKIITTIKKVNKLKIFELHIENKGKNSGKNFIWLKEVDKKRCKEHEQEAHETDQYTEMFILKVVKPM